MIVIAIIGILTSLALPAYNNHFKRSKFTEIVLSSNALQRQIEVCFNINQSIDSCDTFEKVGSKKSNFIAPTYVSDIKITNISGTLQIKATASSEASVSSSGDTYIMNAIVGTNQIKWQLSTLSTCISEGTC